MKPIARNLAMLVALSALVTACSRDGRDMSAPSPDQTQSIAIVTTVAETVGTGFSITTPWADGMRPVMIVERLGMHTGLAT